VKYWPRAHEQTAASASTGGKVRILDEPRLSGRQIAACSRRAAAQHLALLMQEADIDGRRFCAIRSLMRRWECALLTVWLT